MPDNPSGALTGISGIGALRWPVTLCERVQAPGPEGATSESLTVLISLVDPEPAEVTSTRLAAYKRFRGKDTPVLPDDDDERQDRVPRPLKGKRDILDPAQHGRGKPLTTGSFDGQHR
jgi:hypothetical protein